MSLRATTLPSVMALAAAFAVAGCTGGSQMAPAGNAMTTPVQTQSVSGKITPQDHGDCNNQGGLDVTPCRIVFTTQHSTPVNVVVNNQGRTLMERDNCASRGVATIIQTGDNTFTVSAGTSHDFCSAKFTVPKNEKGGGRAMLMVFNQIQ